MELDQKTFLRKLFKIYFYRSCLVYLDVLKHLKIWWMSEYFGYDIDYCVTIQYKNRISCIDDFPYEIQKFIQRYIFFMDYKKQNVYKYQYTVRFDLGLDIITKDVVHELNLRIKNFESKVNYSGYEFCFLKFRFSNILHRIDKVFLDYTLWILE